jgi:hypothetical protein
MTIHLGFLDATNSGGNVNVNLRVSGSVEDEAPPSPETVFPLRYSLEVSLLTQK